MEICIRKKQRDKMQKFGFCRESINRLDSITSTFKATSFEGSIEHILDEAQNLILYDEFVLFEAGTNGVKVSHSSDDRFIGKGIEQFKDLEYLYKNPDKRYVTLSLEGINFFSDENDVSYKTIFFSEIKSYNSHVYLFILNKKYDHISRVRFRLLKYICLMGPVTMERDHSELFSKNGGSSILRRFRLLNVSVFLQKFLIRNMDNVKEVIYLGCSLFRFFLSKISNLNKRIQVLSIGMIGKNNENK